MENPHIADQVNASAGLVSVTCTSCGKKVDAGLDMSNPALPLICSCGTEVLNDVVLAANIALARHETLALADCLATMVSSTMLVLRKDMKPQERLRAELLLKITAEQLSQSYNTVPATTFCNKIFSSLPADGN